MVELADLIGCTQSVISYWEKGTTQPGPKYLKKLKEVFGAEFDIDNIDKIEIVSGGKEPETFTQTEDILQKAILNLTESNKILAESNKLMAKTQAEMMDWQQTIMSRLNKKVMEPV